MKSLLRIVSQKPENVMPQSIRAEKYHDGARLTTVASAAVGILGAANVGSILEHCWTERFSKDEFFLAVLDGRHLCSSI